MAIFSQQEYLNMLEVLRTTINSAPSAGDGGHIDDHTAISIRLNHFPNILYGRGSKQADNSWQFWDPHFGEVEEDDAAVQKLVDDFSETPTGAFVTYTGDFTTAASAAVGTTLFFYNGPDQAYKSMGQSASTLAEIIPQVEDIASTVSTLEGKVSTLTADKETLEGKVSTLESGSATLNTTVSQLGENVTTLTNANSTLEGQVSTLESDNTSLSATVSGLQANFGSLSSANDTLNSTVSALEGNVTTLTSDKEALEGQVSTLESTIAGLTARLEALEAKNPE